MPPSRQELSNEFGWPTQTAGLVFACVPACQGGKVAGGGGEVVALHQQHCSSNQAVLPGSAPPVKDEGHFVNEALQGIFFL